ncbi:MAG TPA: AI-2E family transporter [Stellaceae bacterium]|nr:AI-2E family transporter [Stellaceae bacterium]
MAETLTIGIVAIAALYFARAIFEPLALAILLSFALGPLVLGLRRCHLGRVTSVMTAVVLAFLVIFALGALIGSQIASLAEEVPHYQSNIVKKIQSLRGSAAENGLVAGASEMLTTLGNEIAKTPPPEEKTPANTQAPLPPLPVEIHQPEPTALEIMETIVGPLLQPFAATGITIMFVIFFLLQREDLRDRFIRLAGGQDMQRTTQALDDAGRRLSRYLLMQSAINATVGIVIGTGLWIVGVPNPVLWGTFTMLLRFVPYIGPVIAASFPATLALAVDPGWSMLLWTLALFLVIEPIAGQVVEPVVYGNSTGLSAVAVVVAAAFWTWLWGPIGLLLSTPLTLCLAVLGRHVERLEFLAILLGDQPALSPEENFYQRLLANNPDEAAYQAQAFLKENNPLVVYYDKVVIKALALAQRDINRGALDHERRTQIKETIDEVIDDLADHASASPGSREVLCIAGRSSLDEAVAAMLAQLLGAVAHLVNVRDVMAAVPSALDVHGAKIACLSYLEPTGFTNARYLVRRLRRKLPETKILVGFWTMTQDEVRRRDALKETGADIVVTTLEDAVEAIRNQGY